MFIENVCLPARKRKAPIANAVILACFLTTSSLAQMPNAAAACHDSRIADGPIASSVPRPIVTADTILSIRALLLKQNFTALDTAFARYERATKLDIRNDLAWESAYQAFDLADPRLSAPLDAWIKSSNTTAARLARVTYDVALAFDARGEDSPEKTSDAAFAKMGDHHDDALRNLEPILKADRGNIIAAVLMIDIVMHYYGAPDPQVVARGTLAVSPGSWVVRAAVMRAIEPRWRGSVEAMSKFAQESIGLEERYPQLRALRGYPDGEAGRDLDDADKDHEAFDKYSKTLEYGETGTFRAARGKIYYAFGMNGPAITDFNCAAAYSPGRADVLAYRGLARLALAGDAKTALAKSLREQANADFRTAVELDPTDSGVKWALKNKP